MDVGELDTSTKYPLFWDLGLLERIWLVSHEYIWFRVLEIL